MRLKKGFTLAEVLIVLVVIGAIATLTIPSLMKGVSAAQYKTAYKKGLNNVINIMAMEAASGNKPTGNTGSAVTTLFKTLNTNLAVKDYAPDQIDGAGPDEITVTLADLEDEAGEKTCPTGFTEVSGVCTNSTSGATADHQYVINYGDSENSDWINTEDGLSYQVRPGSSTTCPTKKQINSEEFIEATGQDLTSACLVVVVDTNGVTSGPNTVMPNYIEETSTLEDLTNDRYYIYIAKDGASAGSKKTSKTGRIAADLK